MINGLQRRAINNAISNTEDNLYRCKMQAKRDPEYKTGNGVSISEMVSRLEAELAELKEPIDAQT